MFNKYCAVITGWAMSCFCKDDYWVKLFSDSVLEGNCTNILKPEHPH